MTWANFCLTESVTLLGVCTLRSLVECAGASLRGMGHSSPESTLATYGKHITQLRMRVIKMKIEELPNQSDLKLQHTHKNDLDGVQSVCMYVFEAFM